MTDVDTERLGHLLTRAYRSGVALSSDLLQHPELLDVLAQTRDGEDQMFRVRRGHQLLVSSVASLRSPHSDALRALLDIEPLPPGRRMVLNLTERRERAGTYFNVAGDTFRRHHERRHTQELAGELHRRLKSMEDTVRPVLRVHGREEPPGERTIPKRTQPATPPPPASTYRPRT
ncbi:hypothetical protein [Frankia sp. AgKG'84/4]|uniref:hypothetical protein n=1 Tax=Frankia sp. AgKG'84/4 TaxID=573490 RepID=UPI00200F0A1C|nr:hypothetical protein [Frankia sp. AgKG'84/4]MCL9793777.1 hypothetical protein [Frankia sp. AgKG'84/4]